MAFDFPPTSEIDQGPGVSDAERLQAIWELIESLKLAQYLRIPPTMTRIDATNWAKFVTIYRTPATFRRLRWIGYNENEPPISTLVQKYIGGIGSQNYWYYQATIEALMAEGLNRQQAESRWVQASDAIESEFSVAQQFYTQLRNEYELSEDAMNSVANAQLRNSSFGLTPVELLAAFGPDPAWGLQAGGTYTIDFLQRNLPALPSAPPPPPPPQEVFPPDPPLYPVGTVVVYRDLRIDSRQWVVTEVFPEPGNPLNWLYSITSLSGAEDVRHAREAPLQPSPGKEALEDAVRDLAKAEEQRFQILRTDIEAGTGNIGLIVQESVEGATAAQIDRLASIINEQRLQADITNTAISAVPTAVAQFVGPLVEETGKGIVDALEASVGAIQLPSLDFPTQLLEFLANPLAYILERSGGVSQEVLDSVSN